MVMKTNFKYQTTEQVVSELFSLLHSMKDETLNQVEESWGKLYGADSKQVERARAVKRSREINRKRGYH